MHQCVSMSTPRLFEAVGQPHSPILHRWIPETSPQLSRDTLIDSPAATLRTYLGLLEVSWYLAILSFSSLSTRSMAPGSQVATASHSALGSANPKRLNTFWFSVVQL